MKVFLIGAGPGDPGLLTIKGRDALAAADVVVYDAGQEAPCRGHDLVRVGQEFGVLQDRRGQGLP